jgi:hypothetical protein
MGTVLLVLTISAVLAWYFLSFARDVEEPVALCGGCHCIPEDGEACPTDTAPNSTTVPTDVLDVWRSQTPLNPYTLDCNPHEDGTYCSTEPPLDDGLLLLGDTAVCAIHYAGDADNNSTTAARQLPCEGSSYHLATYPSREAAEAAGGHVTHAGHCGVCSTLQDLAAYAEFMQPTSPGNFCRRQAVQSLENGLACYRGLGMTLDCARIWSDTSWNTAKNCFTSCVVDPTVPAQVGDAVSRSSVTNTSSSGDASAEAADAECGPSECVKCDDEVSAPTFERYAGRTRQRSGLLSTSVRSCSALSSVVLDSCPTTLPWPEGGIRR